MATLITKNSSTASSIPTAAQLVQGELAVNVADKRIFTENSAGAVVELGTNPSSVTTGTLTTTGNVGVGTSTPGNKLSVIGDARLSLTTTGTSYPLLLENSNTTGVVAAAIAFQNNGTTKASIQAGVFGNDFMTFNVGSNTERVRIDASGNVGIGTSSPGSKFAVGNATDQVQAGISGAVSIIYLGTPNTSSGGQSTLSYNRANGTTSIGSSSAGVSLGSAINVDSNGNVGIGTSSPGSKLEVKGAGFTALSVSGDSTSETQLRFNTNASARISQQSNQPLLFDTNATERMRIDASGNVGIGGVNSASLGKLEITGSGYQALGVVATDTSGVKLAIASNASSEARINVVSAHPLVMYTNNTERARIDASGNLLVGTTSTVGGDSPKMSVSGDACIATKSSTTGLTAAIGFHNPNGRIGYIGVSGTTTSYVTSSDYRLKDTIAPMTGALARVAALRPCTYKWIVDGSDGQGFIAHELAEVEPGCVTGEKDATETRTVETSPAVPAKFDADGVETSPAVAAVTEEQVFPKYQGIDTSFLVATLAAAIQEQQVLIKDLTDRLAALEAK